MSMDYEQRLKKNEDMVRKMYGAYLSLEDKLNTVLGLVAEIHSLIEDTVCIVTEAGMDIKKARKEWDTQKLSNKGGTL